MSDRVRGLRLPESRNIQQRLSTPNWILRRGYDESKNKQRVNLVTPLRREQRRALFDLS